MLVGPDAGSGRGEGRTPGEAPLPSWLPDGSQPSSISYTRPPTVELARTASRAGGWRGERPKLATSAAAVITNPTPEAISSFDPPRHCSRTVRTPIWSRKGAAQARYRSSLFTTVTFDGPTLSGIAHPHGVIPPTPLPDAVRRPVDQCRGRSAGGCVTVPIACAPPSNGCVPDPRPVSFPPAVFGCCDVCCDGSR